jgi:hypothetical protein
MTKIKALYEWPMTPNELLRYALGHEPGSRDWQWAVLSALRLASEQPRGRPRQNLEMELRLMAMIHIETGENRPYVLARKTVDTYNIPRLGADHRNVVDKLARAWKNTSRSELDSFLNDARRFHDGQISF